MMHFFKLFAVSIPIFFAIDMLWLGVIAKNLYAKLIGHLLKSDVNWIAAFVFYAIFLCGLTFFVTLPALEKKSLAFAAVAGALFGLVTYATYDLTNLAVAKDWPLSVTLIDLAWGTTLSCLTASLTYVIARNIS